MVWKLAPSVTHVMEERLAELADAAPPPLPSTSTSTSITTATLTDDGLHDNRSDMVAVTPVMLPITATVVLKSAPPPLPAIRTSGFDRGGSTGDVGSSLPSTAAPPVPPVADPPVTARLGVSSLLAVTAPGDVVSLAGAGAGSGTQSSDVPVPSTATTMHPGGMSRSNITDSVVHDVGQPTDGDSDDSYSGVSVFALPADGSRTGVGNACLACGVPVQMYLTLSVMTVMMTAMTPLNPRRSRSPSLLLTKMS